jgi:16S rRNA (cytosine967-C5)-methyltransferase
MTPGARIQAAIEILEELEREPQPADKAMKSWGTAHRFAGAKDRAAIRSLIFATYRHRGAAAMLMGAQNARALVLGGLRLGIGWKAGDIDAAMTGRAHDAAPLTAEERARLEGPRPKADGALNWPDWLAEKMRAAHGEAAEPLMAALMETAPLDIRVNSLKAKREDVIAALTSVGFPAEPTPYSPLGIRIARDEDLVGANIRTLPMFRSGVIDVQDEGSQLVSLLAGAAPGQQVLELCAGGGGKTLALASSMGQSGQIYACDVDVRRLKAGQERVARAGVHNVQPKLIHHWSAQEEGRDPDLEEYAGKMDLVFLDVPCTGSGAWRRQPDAKWQLAPARLAEFVALQASILERGRRLVKPGGRLAYVTCSVFAEENAEQVSAFLARHKNDSPLPLREGVRAMSESSSGAFAARTGRGRNGESLSETPHHSPPPQGGRGSGWGLLDLGPVWRDRIGGEQPLGTRVASAVAAHALQLSPIATGTDGFFFALLERTA